MSVSPISYSVDFRASRDIPIGATALLEWPANGRTHKVRLRQTAHSCLRLPNCVNCLDFVPMGLTNKGPSKSIVELLERSTAVCLQIRNRTLVLVQSSYQADLRGKLS